MAQPYFRQKSGRLVPDFWVYLPITKCVKKDGIHIISNDAKVTYHY